MEQRRPKMTNATVQVLDVLINGAGRLYGLKIAQSTGLMTGTVYPILARLERAGWVASYWEDGGPDERGSRRRFYQLTDHGLEQSKAVVAERVKQAHRGFPQTETA